MQMRWKISKIGDVRKVKPVEFGYPLPAGLLEGTTVKLVSFDHGYFTVIAPDGNEYEIHMMCVCHPEEFLLDGRWWAEDHPKIRSEFAKPKHLRREA